MSGQQGPDCLMVHSYSSSVIEWLLAAGRLAWGYCGSLLSACQNFLRLCQGHRPAAPDRAVPRFSAHGVFVMLTYVGTLLVVWWTYYCSWYVVVTDVVVSDTSEHGGQTSTPLWIHAILIERAVAATDSSNGDPFDTPFITSLRPHHHSFPPCFLALKNKRGRPLQDCSKAQAEQDKARFRPRSANALTSRLSRTVTRGLQKSHFPPIFSLRLLLFFTFHCSLQQDNSLVDILTSTTITLCSQAKDRPKLSWKTHNFAVIHTGHLYSKDSSGYL